MRRYVLATLGAWLIATSAVAAQNPAIQVLYTADPAPVVYRDTVFLYVGHDEPNAPDNKFLMREYRLFTSVDMVNWTAHPAPLKTSAFAWSAGDASAAQCIERDGKWYFYVSTLNKDHPGVSVGVAVADSPYGPFRDAQGEALVTNDMTTFGKHSWDDLDPTVFVEEGQAYLYWGNNACYRARLNNDMVSLAGEITALDIFDPQVFGPDFEEAPWVYRHGDRFYLIYASDPNESLHYAMATGPEGPWRYGGKLMDRTGSSGSNHPAVIEFQGQSYLFYHTGELPGGGDFKRSVCIEPFSYRPDGSIPPIPKTRRGVTEAVASQDPYRRTEAETIAWSEGLAVADGDSVGMYVGSIHDGDYLKVRNVDFGPEGPTALQASISSRYLGGSLEIRLDAVDVDSVGVLRVPYLGHWDDWRSLTTEVAQIRGVHDLYFVFRGGAPQELFRFDYWQFR
ncbi:glycoside hydrolase family 43 protein [Lewinella sp. IMCC34191]|uniref:glycoside hydrolase family 43 protein n=1 Tax=Lewinella sp. IMCC34191 TaxID=2259172 RepID=UPI000E2462CB|nr:glycoside hydrolase family 43 protein [Lewinella sp. IMCC34191]